MADYLEVEKCRHREESIRLTVLQIESEWEVQKAANEEYQIRSLMNSLYEHEEFALKISRVNSYFYHWITNCSAYSKSSISSTRKCHTSFNVIEIFSTESRKKNEQRTSCQDSLLRNVQMTTVNKLTTISKSWPISWNYYHQNNKL